MTEAEWVDLASRKYHVQETVVPDASAPLLTSLLHVDPGSSGSCLLVSFPIGWERGPGSYSCFEHAVVLEGSIDLDGDRWEAGTAFVVPAKAQRRRTFAPTGALVLAWFSAAPRWTGGGRVDGPASSHLWVGDPVDANTATDEVDLVGRRWRHLMPGLSTEDAYLHYSWIH
jgi:hypothetical protein